MSNIIRGVELLGAEVVSLARGWLGTPYRHGASVKGVGADCLGLLRGVYGELYGEGRVPAPPPYTPDWGEVSDARGEVKEVLLEAARCYLVEKGVGEAGVGDVALFRLFEYGPIKHCAILTGGEGMIHAYSNHHVCEVALGRWWRRRITHIFSFPLGGDILRGGVS